MRQLTEGTPWTFTTDGAGFRRVVPSPAPQRIRGINSIRRLVDASDLRHLRWGRRYSRLVTDDWRASRGRGSD